MQFVRWINSTTTKVFGPDSTLQTASARRHKKYARRVQPILIVAAAAAAAFFCGYHRALSQTTAPFCRSADLTTSPEAIVTQAQEAGIDPELKRVCLTFDDGPSQNTPEVLRILAENEVPATFFVIAAENNLEYLPLVQQEMEQGCQVALHSCTHDYERIYQSTDAYWEDIEALKQQLRAYIDLTGVDCIRFPGGSTNTVSRKYGGSEIMKELKLQAEELGYHWVDWNVCADDAVGGRPSASKIYKNVIEDVKEQKTCVVLMHDTAATGSTVEALPDIIGWFKENGYTFCTVSELYR